MEITEFINGKVHYDEHGTYIWITTPQGGIQMLAEIRGFGHIQNLVKSKLGKFDMEEAAAFQDEVGKWIAEAINEKLDRVNQPTAKNK